MNHMTRDAFVHFSRLEVIRKNVLFFVLVLLATLMLCGLTIPQALLAAPGDIQTIAGGGVGDGDAATSAVIYAAYSVALDVQGKFI